MQLITYFGFTLVSILIQFCVMDLINENNDIDKMIENRSRIEIEGVQKHSRRDMQPILSKFSKPHGLFYRTDKTAINDKSSLKLYNASLVDLTTTELTSTILDWAYDENISTTEDAYHITDTFTSSEFENVTEITLFDKKMTTMKPNTITKKVAQNQCYCNILYKTCDIGCCCDIDCSETERNLFDCKKKTCQDSGIDRIHLCSSDTTCPNKMTTYFLENLFCISKTNLPDKRLTDIQFDETAINRSPKWRKHNRQEALYEFKNIYKYKQPIWSFQNGSIFTADIPIAISNNYCSGKKSIKFLIHENVKCIVKLQELHMFQVLKVVEEGSILSPIVSFSNTTDKNMTSFHQTNWTLYVCDESECFTYNKSRHEPFCTDSYCKNIATDIHYKFYYFDSKIIKAVIKFHIQKVLTQVQFLTQNVKVKFYLSDKPVNDIIKLSGNPGYIWNLPIIISTVKQNHTMHFFNNTLGKSVLTYPENKNGECILSNISYNILQFGQNKRSKCRFHIRQDIELSNATSACQNIQNIIFRYLGLDSTIYVSPYGNPNLIKDENWIPIQMFNKDYVYGILEKKTLLHCTNLVAGIAYRIAYADINSDIDKETNKILHVNVEGTAQNITFYTDDVSTVLTIDTNFIDISKPIVEYAGAPHLTIHLPKTFFLPNSGNHLQDSTKYLRFILLLSSCILKAIK